MLRWACSLGLAAGCAGWPVAVLGQLKVVPQTEPQCLFCGEAQKVAVTVQNLDSKPLEADLETRLFQTSSATAVLVLEAPWKRLQVLGGQTVVESAVLRLPPVTAPTRFLVEWMEKAGHVIGKTQLWVYPPGLLKDLKPLLGDNSLGVLDPQNGLKPLLKDIGVEVVDLENSSLEDFSGTLAIIGPFQSKLQMREGLARQIKRMAERGTGVVWLAPPVARREGIMPSFYTVPEGKGTVVIAEPDLVAGLAENPKAQLNLTRFAGLALHPEPGHLPFLLSGE